MRSGGNPNVVDGATSAAFSPLPNGNGGINAPDGASCGGRAAAPSATAAGFALSSFSVATSFAVSFVPIVSSVSAGGTLASGGTKGFTGVGESEAGTRMSGFGTKTELPLTGAFSSNISARSWSNDSGRFDPSGLVGGSDPPLNTSLNRSASGGRGSAGLISFEGTSGLASIAGSD